MADDWFEGEGRTDPERRFIAALRERARGWAALDVRPVDTQAWTDSAALYVHVDIVDPASRLIVGTLRIDCDGARVLGHWGHHQLIDEVDTTKPDSFCSPPLESPEEAARHAAAWLENQFRRPVERREWRQGATVTRTLWLLADTGRVLVTAGSGLPTSEPGGRWSHGLGLPDGLLTVVQVRPPRQA